MKIKRYTAPSMRDALALIRAEQGPEAVILSSRRLEEGVEVVSAIDYDAALMGEANRQSPPVLRPPEPPARKPEVAQPLRQEPEYDHIQRELKDMRQFLESELAVLGWQDRRKKDPINSKVLEELSALDIAPDVTRALAAHLPRRTTAKNPAHIPLALLVKYLPMHSDNSCIEGGVVAVVGPTGVGKTTTIAKLAARWCLQHGSQDLALVSTDSYRIGARDQLLTYARILGAPMHVANGGKELAQVLGRLKDKRLVLIDTAGMSQRDVRIPEQLDALRLGIAQARVLLALSAAADSKTLDEIVRVYARIKPLACVLTKIDEAASLGGVLSAVLRHELPIAYLCDGQRVPEDMHGAEDRRLWLVRTALKLKEQAQPLENERFMARNFGRVQTHA